MDNNKIFIDTDTEITFIVEKILNSRTEKVTLVIPDRASVLTSITGLKLIKRVIDKSNKLLVLVTLDDQGAALARKAELTVVSRVGEVNDKVWESIQKAKFEYIKKSKMQNHYMPEIIENNYQVKPSFIADTNENKMDEEIKEEEEVEVEHHVEEPKGNDSVKEVPQISINLGEVRSINNIVEINDEIPNSEFNFIEDETEAKDITKINNKTIESKNDNSSRRKKASTKDSEITNLSFNVGKDISDEKKKLFRIE